VDVYNFFFTMGGAGVDPFDIFNSFFGGGGGRQLTLSKGQTICL
jgi:DnaJ-class molecular chaperone